MRKEIMQALQQEYEQQRLKNSQEEMRRRQEVITRCPERLGSTSPSART